MFIVGVYVWWEGQGHGDTSSETSHAIGENLGFFTYVSRKDKNVNTQSRLSVAFAGCKTDW